MPTTFETFKNKIQYRLHKRFGYRMTKSSQLAKNIVQRVRNDSGGGTLWKVKMKHGKYSASQYSSLNDFITALEEVSIPTGIDELNGNQELLRTLMKKFQTSSAIEAVSAFTKQYTPVDTASLRQKFNEFFSPIKNDAKSLVDQAKKNLNEWKNTKAVTFSELQTKILSLRTPATFVKTMFGFFGTRSSLEVDTEVTMWFLPLGGMGINSPISITDIDVAHSNKIVKYRAVGSIYLAHQVGGKDSIKITGKLTGEMRQLYLTMLWLLTLLSQGHWEVVDWNSDLVKTISSGDDTPYSMRDGVGNMLPMQKVDNVITQEPAYQKHVTFPVITQHEIIPNCYIETFSFEEKIENQRDVITYDIMMRTYVEPKEFLADTKRSQIRVNKVETRTEQVIKYSINFIYRLIQYYKNQLYHIDSGNWKVKNYYDLDAMDIGFATGLSLAGVIAG